VIITGRRKFKSSRVWDGYKRPGGGKGDENREVAHLFPPSTALPCTPFSLYLCYPSFLHHPPIIEAKLVRRSCVRDTYGLAPSVGLVRSTITKIPPSPFLSSTRHRGFRCNRRGLGFDTALGGSRVGHRRFFGRWSCRRYVAALLLHDGTVLSNLFFFFLSPSPLRHTFCVTGC